MRLLEIKMGRDWTTWIGEDGRNVQGPVLEVVDMVLAEVFEGISLEELLSTKDVLRRVLANAHEGDE